MSGPVTREGAAKMADMVAKIAAQLPEGMAFVAFLVVEKDEGFEAVVTATVPPSVFAPVLRGWVARYAAGEAAEVNGHA